MTIKITPKMLETKLAACKENAATARGASERKFWIAEVARIARMLEG